MDTPSSSSSSEDESQHLDPWPEIDYKIMGGKQVGNFSSFGSICLGLHEYYPTSKEVSIYATDESPLSIRQFTRNSSSAMTAIFPRDKSFLDRLWKCLPDLTLRFPRCEQIHYFFWSLANEWGQTGLDRVRSVVIDDFASGDFHYQAPAILAKCPNLERIKIFYCYNCVDTRAPPGIREIWRRRIVRQQSKPTVESSVRFIPCDKCNKHGAPPSLNFKHKRTSDVEVHHLKSRWPLLPMVRNRTDKGVCVINAPGTKHPRKIALVHVQDGSLDNAMLEEDLEISPGSSPESSRESIS